ncbi:peptidylprolyl isomerase [Desulfamplus magnetovallimortis]|nr:peptidylprolyl isomerase [Desulfamplus magnetovallimortis]
MIGILSFECFSLFCYAEESEKIFFSGDGFSVTQKDLDAENEMLSASFDTTKEEKLRVILMDRLFKLEYQSTSDDLLLDKKVQRMTEKYLALLYKKKLDSQIEISEDVLQSYYIANPELFTEPQKYRLQLLMVSNKVVCDKIFSDVTQNKRTFELAVEEESIDKETTPNKGELEWMAENKMPREFAANVENLLPGDVSQPFQYNGNWVLLKVLEMKPPEKKVYEDVKDSIRSTLTRKKMFAQVNSEFERLKAKYQVKDEGM